MAIHTIHYLLEKDLKILEGFPKIDQKAEEMGERRKGDQATRQFETIQVIIIEAELLFFAPSMLILKNFLITPQPRTQGFTLERGRGGPSKGKAGD